MTGAVATTGTASAEALLATLQRWRSAGWLRALDLAFARFIHTLDPSAPASLLLATALLSQLESRGHSCLPLDLLAHDPAALLGWPDEAMSDLRSTLSDVGAWPVQEDAAARSWHATTVLQHVGQTGAASAPSEDATPLVLAGNQPDLRLYLRRYWRHESQVAQQVLARSRVGDAAPETSSDPAWRSRARALFQLLFDAPAGAQGAAQPDWQQVACAVALRGRLTLVTGGPGTGKTHTAARLLVLLQALHTGPQPLRVALAAPTGKAAARLRQSIATALHALQPRLLAAPDVLPTAKLAGLQVPTSTTLHTLLGTRADSRRFRHDAANPLDVDLLFVDEASMVHLEMMDALLAALPPSARLVLLGDKDQLASVEAGAVLGDLCQPAGTAQPAYDERTVQWVRDVAGQDIAAAVEIPARSTEAGNDLAQQTVVLRHSHRFAGPIGQLAWAVNRGDGAAAVQLLRAEGDVRDADDSKHVGGVRLVDTQHHTAADVVAALAIDGRAAGYRHYLQLLAQRPSAAADFDGWASAVLRQFDRCRVLCAVHDGPWGASGLNMAIERTLATRGLLQRRGEWYVGRPVMVTRNDRALGVFNGDIGVVLRAPVAAGDAMSSNAQGDLPGDTAALRVFFLDGDALRSVAVGRLADLDTAFAMTVHKSQGSEFEHVLLVLPEADAAVLTRELLYTGVTRARAALTVVCSGDAPVLAATGRRTRRVSGLRQLLRAGLPPQGS